jgi:hypothetical protein
LQKVASATEDCLFVDAAQVARAGDDGIHFSEEAHTALGRTLATLL